jgi:hypothetical protein
MVMAWIKVKAAILLETTDTEIAAIISHFWNGHNSLARYSGPARSRFAGDWAGCSGAL